MKAPIFSILGLPWHLLFLLTCASATLWQHPRVGVPHGAKGRNPNTVSTMESNDFEMFFYTQTLDHFNCRPDSYITFQQRYTINFKYWTGANTSAPIMAFLGEECGLECDVESNGFLSNIAARFDALLVYIEHRYYGKSLPFGSRKEAFANASTLGYLSSAQALADYADVIVSLKKNFSAEASPVIVVGCSYGGMLASWFRLKYPHIAVGALASSAPILYFDNVTPQNGYYSVVTKDFKEASESCYNSIKQSWFEIDKIASMASGLSILSKKFKTCSPLKTSFELKDYLDSIYAEAAQYGLPQEQPVHRICRAIDGASKGTDILGRIYAGVLAYKGKQQCYDVNEFNYPTESSPAWNWQACTELIIRIGHDRNDTMFQFSPFNLNNRIKQCNGLYGVLPRPHWVTTQYGGHDIKMILKRFASNIIFSNGLQDPYSSAGVLENISDSVLAVYTAKGCHCLDMIPARKDDPKWLVMQRNIEVEIIDKWITRYYEDIGEKK